MEELISTEMTKYQQGKVYCIKSQHTSNIYIGSTIQPLSYRMSIHNYHYRKHIKGEHGNISSFDIIKFGDAYIELIENYPCANKEELEKREGEIIRESPNSINNKIPGRTPQQYYEDNKESIREHAKQYYEDNKEHFKKYYEDNKEYYKKYREDNKESIREYAKQYYEDNKEYYNQYFKQYRENNKESIREHSKQYYEDNKESIIERYKQYYEDNKESIREHAKQYYEDNKESMREYAKQYYEVKLYYQKNKIKFKNNLKQWIEKNKAIRVCICGKSYNYGHKQTRENHYKTQRHTNFVLEVRKNFII